MSTVIRYKSKRLECWEKGKELVIEHYKNIQTAREKGKLLILSCAGTPYFIFAGLGDFVLFAGEPYAATVAAIPEFSLKCMEAFEARGYQQDMCGYMKNFCGSMFLDKYLLGGPFPKIDFILSSHYCACGHPFWHRIVADYQGIPQFQIDDDIEHPRSGNREQAIEYVVNQYLDAIEWMERTTGRKYEDEKAIECMERTQRIETLWGEINLLAGAVPAPIDAKSLLALMPIHMLRRNEDISEQFLITLRDELKERVANEIAILGTERFRMAATQPPAWSYLRMFRVLEEYGVVFVSTVTYTTWGVFDFRDDGTVAPAKTARELGWPRPKNREEMIWTYIKWRGSHKRATFGLFGPSERGMSALVQLAKAWKVDAMALMLNRGCPPMNIGMYSVVKPYLVKHGIPTVIFEANYADCREADPARTIDTLVSFLESLGLRKLPKT